MSGKGNSARYSQSRTDTRIGTGMRVEGNMTFTGVLRVEGGILGNLSCDDDGKGTIVVGQSGHVDGALSAPHIVVGGRVAGPSYSSKSIEIQAGAYLVGDTYYKAIEVHAGGVVEGSLTPRPSTDAESLPAGPSTRRTDPRDAGERSGPLADGVRAGSAERNRSWGGRALGLTVVLLMAVATLVWVNRQPIPAPPPPGDPALKGGPMVSEPAPTQSAPAEIAKPQEGAPGVPANPVPSPASHGATARDLGQPSPAAIPAADPAVVVTIQGVNPRKPPDLVSVTSKEPSVVFKKKRQDPSDGTRIDIAEGATKTISIAKDDLFRVAEGRNIMIFYQGRMVAPRTVDSGAWMSFVPQPHDDTSAQR